jgi:PEP-CTERM motif
MSLIRSKGKWRITLLFAPRAYRVPAPAPCPRAESRQLRTYMPSLFKTIGAVLCLVFALSFAVPNAHADSYSATFTGGPTALDVTFPSPTLDITWQGFAFSITLPSSSLFTDLYSWGSSRACANGICVARMDIFDSTHPSDTFSNSVSVPTSFSTSAGFLTFTPVATATPEPSSVALLLSGVGLVFAMRKRSSGLQQAS